MLKRILLFLICFSVLLLLAAHEEETGGVFASGLEDEIDAFTTDFDGKTLGGANTLVVQQVTKNHGDDAAEGNFDGTNIEGYAYTTVTEQATNLYLRAYFYFSADFAPTDTWKYAGLLMIRDGATWLADVHFGTDGVGTLWGRLYLQLPFVGNVGNKIAISKGAWHYIEIRYLVHGATGGVEWWLDGASQASSYVSDSSGNAPDNFRIGVQDRGADNFIPIAASELYWDDVKVDSSYIGAYSAPTTFFPKIIIIGEDND